MRKLPLFILLCITFFVVGSMVARVSKSDELDDINKQINDLTASLNMSVKATQPLESELTKLRTQITDIKNRVATIEVDVSIKKKNIDQGYKDLERQTAILNKTVRDFYIRSYNDSPLLTILSAKSASDITQILAYQKAAADQDKAIITNIALSIADLEEKKKNLEDEETRLAALKANLDDQSAKLDKVVAGAKAYQANLSGQIAVLSARQQQILSQRLSSLNIPLYAYSTQGGCSSDLTNGKDPGFSGGFGFFTYGVPNRVGLNQYGAFGRARAGQSYQQILQAYYNFDSIDTRNAQINVDGYGSFSLDDYVKRIYEVPNEWGDQGGMEALKAQAIAARSYALAYTNNGSGSICTTQQCQVFKPDPKGGNWENAVNATAGQVMVKGGNAIKAWFSSTHGGYIFSSGSIGWSGSDWTKDGKDTNGDISSFSDLQSKAYDKDSPWFYCDWGGRSDHGNTAWLKPEEVADIINVLMLVQKDSSTKEHVYQLDKDNPAGTDTWDAGRVKSELQNRGGTPYNSVSSITVSADFGSGTTTSVTVSGDAGSVSFNGSDFKTYFNLRAPATIQIVGPLYNIERK